MITYKQIKQIGLKWWHRYVRTTLAMTSGKEDGRKDQEHDYWELFQCHKIWCSWCSEAMPCIQDVQHRTPSHRM